MTSCGRCGVAIDGRIRQPQLVFVSVAARVLRDATLCVDCRERVVPQLREAFDAAMQLSLLEAGEGVGV